MIPIFMQLFMVRVAARVFYLFDHGRELREIVQELEVPPSVVRDLWHEWLIGLEDGEMSGRGLIKKDGPTVERQL